MSLRSWIIYPIVMIMKSRKSPRAQRYDYTSPWWYFVTICTKDRAHYFGEIGRDDSSNHPIMIFNELGKYCDQEIQRLSDRKSVDVHERVVMPNHIHILLIMSEYPIVGVDHQSTLNNKIEWQKSTLNNRSSISDDLSNRPYDGPSLSSIVKLFKWNITKYTQEHDIIFARQRSFHDHIIRNEEEYNRIKYYIQTNPQNRDTDSLQ